MEIQSNFDTPKSEIFYGFIFYKKVDVNIFCLIIQKLFKFDFNFPVLGLS